MFGRACVCVGLCVYVCVRARALLCETRLQVGKNYANKRPTSYKTALMTMTNTVTTRRRSRSRSPPRDFQAQRRFGVKGLWFRV